MLVNLLFIIIVVLFLVVTEDYLGNYKWVAYVFVGICLMMYAGFRPIGFDRDSPNYEQLFMHPDAKIAGISVEPSFLWISKALYFIWPDVRSILFLFAAAGVTIKFCAIKRLTPLYFLPVLIYLGNFFLLHEVTQIRAGIVSGLFLLSLKPLSEDKKLHAFCYMAGGALFHYSALALLPLLLLDNRPITWKWKIALSLTVPLCFLLYASNLDLLTSVPIPYITEKVEAYKALSENVLEKESILNPFPLIKMTVFLYFLYFSETIREYVPSIYLLIKILCCSLLVYFLFSSIKIVSMRISELYGIVELVAYPCIIFTIRPVSIGKCAVCVIAFIELYFNLIQWEILDFSI